MGAWVEITGLAWLCIVDNKKQCTKREQVGQAEKIYYSAMGCHLMMIKQPSSPTQYFIKDINA